MCSTPRDTIEKGAQVLRVGHPRRQPIGEGKPPRAYLPKGRARQEAPARRAPPAPSQPTRRVGGTSFGDEAEDTGKAYLRRTDPDPWGFNHLQTSPIQRLDRHVEHRRIDIHAYEYLGASSVPLAAHSSDGSKSLYG